MCVKAELTVVYTAKKGGNEQTNETRTREGIKERQKKAALGESKGPEFLHMQIINIFENRMKLG